MEIKKVLLIIVKKKNFLQYFRPWNGVEVGEDAMQKSREEKKKKKKKKIGWARSRRVINRNHDFLGNIRNPRAIQ